MEYVDGLGGDVLTDAACDAGGEEVEEEGGEMVAYCEEGWHCFFVVVLCLNGASLC
jgi:hypothetical protein